MVGLKTPTTQAGLLAAICAWLWLGAAAPGERAHACLRRGSGPVAAM